jgi:hypothetical protein
MGRFSLSLKENKTALKHLLAINGDLVFGNGVICALHKGLFMFSAIQVDCRSDFTIRSCERLENMLSSKQFDKISIDLTNGKITATKPYRYSVGTPEKDDYMDMIEEVKTRLEIVDKLESAKSGLYHRRTGNDRPLSVIADVDTSILIDMIERFDDQSEIMLETFGNTVKLSSGQDEASCELEYSLPTTRVLIDEHETGIFKSSFLRGEGESSKSKLIIADSAFVLILNQAATIISCMEN